MSDNLPENLTVETENLIAEKVEPPEIELAAHSLFVEAKTWLVVAKNRRVNRDWEALMQRHPENTLRCYEDLCKNPNLKKPGRVFPLKGKRYKGAWEYELTKGDRVFYTLDEEKMKVIVYYAGKHVKPAPIP